MRTLFVIGLLLAVAGLAGSAQALPSSTVYIQDVQSASSSLSSFRGTVQMTRHETSGTSVIVYDVAFIPPDKMRIEYTAPATLKGQRLIVNGDQFYTYIPSLNRTIRKKVDASSDAQGQEMGFLYDFIDRKAAQFFALYTLDSLTGPDPYTLETGSTAIEVFTSTFADQKTQQKIKTHATDCVPVSVDIYSAGTLTMEVRLLNYALNVAIPSDTFAIPAG